MAFMDIAHNRITVAGDAFFFDIIPVPRHIVESDFFDHLSPVFTDDQYWPLIIQPQLKYKICLDELMINLPVLELHLG